MPKKSVQRGESLRQGEHLHQVDLNLDDEGKESLKGSFETLALFLSEHANFFEVSRNFEKCEESDELSTATSGLWYAVVVKLFPIVTIPPWNKIFRVYTNH